jgi:hypothetical protein
MKKKPAIFFNFCFFPFAVQHHGAVRNHGFQQIDLHFPTVIPGNEQHAVHCAVEFTHHVAICLVGHESLVLSDEGVDEHYQPSFSASFLAAQHIQPLDIFTRFLDDMRDNVHESVKPPQKVLLDMPKSDFIYLFISLGSPTHHMSLSYSVVVAIAWFPTPQMMTGRKVIASAAHSIPGRH